MVGLEAQTTNEIWRPCVGYEERYEVSNLGRVRNLPFIINDSNGRNRRHPSKIKKQCESGKRKGAQGYLCTRMLSKDRNSNAEFVHRLVAEAFIPNPDNLPTVNHKDGNKHNNVVENLEWASFSENNQHAYDNNLKTDNQIILKTTIDGKLIDVFVSENAAMRKSGYSKKKLMRFCDKHIVDDFGYMWHRFFPYKFILSDNLQDTTVFVPQMTTEEFKNVASALMVHVETTT